MIVDVRDYHVVPGKLDTLIERFEGVFLDEQERLGAQILGIFRDADDPDRYVWLRACADLPARLRLLTDFYSDGEMWRQHRDEVNTWFIDTDNVLLMRPVTSWGTPSPAPSVVAMYSYLRKEPLPAAVTAELARVVPAAVAAAGGHLLVTLATDPAENNYPRHPIRTGEHGFIWFATFPSHQRLGLDGITERHLIPTARSQMR